MVASVSVFLPPSLPEAVLIKALDVRESTLEVVVVAVFSLEDTHSV